MLYGEGLVHIGIGIMIAAAIAAIAIAVIAGVRGKRLRTRLEAEYGKKRH